MGQYEKLVDMFKSIVLFSTTIRIVSWDLQTHVHKPSDRYDPSRMIEEITGKKITAKPFINYLE